MASYGSVLSARGAHRRIQALVARGWSQQKLADEMGVSRSTIFMLMLRPGVRTTRHLEVVVLYERLWNVAPPLASRWDRAAATRSTNHARSEGWPPPLAWDDIDEDSCPAAPDEAVDIDDIAVELAVAGEDVRVTTAERRQALRVLHSRRLTDGDIAVLLRVTSRTVLRIREELGISHNFTPARERVAA